MNYGKLIKAIAWIYFAVETVACSIGGLILCTYAGIIGIVLVLGGPLVFFTITVFVAGFGDLVENCGIIAEKVKNQNKVDKTNFISQNNFHPNREANHTKSNKVKNNKASNHDEMSEVPSEQEPQIMVCDGCRQNKTLNIYRNVRTGLIYNLCDDCAASSSGLVKFE